MKLIFIIIGILIITLIISFFYFLNNYFSIKDDHGCLINQGYSWNEEIKSCIKEKSLDQDQRKAAKYAVSHLSYYTTIIDVKNLDCVGCYEVIIKRNDNDEKNTVRLEDWRIKI
jgi:hypothetical protein